MKQDWRLKIILEFFCVEYLELLTKIGYSSWIREGFDKYSSRMKIEMFECFIFCVHPITDQLLFVWPMAGLEIMSGLQYVYL